MRRRVLPLSMMLAAITLFAMASMSLRAQCPGTLASWTLRVPITVENSGSPLNNYLLLLTVNTQTPISESKMLADGGDIRFADDNCNVMDYWVQDGLNTTGTKIWVKVPTLPGGTTTLYLYYGNPDATHTNQHSDVFGNGLVALYTYTEGEGSILHDWVGGYDLDVSCSWTSSFRNGVGALTGFTGGGRAFINSNGPSLNSGSFTVIDYINPIADGNTQGIVGNYNDDPFSGWTHKLQGGPGEFMLLTNENGDWCQQNVGSLTNNQWQMAGVRRTAGNVNNGLQNGAVTGIDFCNGDQRNVDNDGPFEIGHTYNGGSPFNGSISMTLIYNVSLTTQEIQTIHNSIFAPADPTPTIGEEETIVPPEITSNPESATACVGEAVTFSIEATGTRLTYQWRRNGTPVPGETNPTLTIDPVTPSKAGNYDCVVNNRVTSSVATLTVNQPAYVINNPGSQTVCAGQPTAFSVVAGGTDITYQWRRNGEPILGATGPQYVIPATYVENMGDFDCVVTAICGEPAVSAAATITVHRAPTVLGSTGDVTICRGQVASFSVEAIGEGLTYQWRKNGTPIEGATKPTFNLTAQPYSAGAYDCVVSGICEPSSTTEPARLTVNLDPIISEQPISRTVTLGGSVTFKVTAFGGGVLTYQWQKDGINMPGKTSSTLTIDNISTTDVAEYSCIIHGTICSEFEPTITDKASLILNIPPVIIKNPENVSVCENAKATLSVTAGGLGLGYQWRKNGTPIPGANGRDLVIENATAADAGSYDCVVTAPSLGTPLVSTAATVTINTPVGLTAQPQDATVCPGTPASFTVGATGTGITYQWRRNGVDIPNETSATLSIAAASEADTGAYTVVVVGNCADPMTSAVAHLVLNEKPSITLQPTPVDAPKNGTVVLTVQAAGTGLTYQWRKDGAAISGATTATYTINNAQPEQSGNYDCVVTGVCEPAATSTAVRVNVSTLGVPNYDATTGATLTVVPHPATGTTRMSIRLPRGVHAGTGAALLLYDAMGRAVMNLSDAFERGGYTSAEFNAATLPAGTYYCKLSSGTFTATLGSIVVVH